MTAASCPKWCVEVHDSLNPLADNIHMSADVDLSHIFIPGAGDGSASADIRRIIHRGVEGLYLDVSIETEMKLKDVEAVATEFDRLAAAIRQFSEDS